MVVAAFLSLVSFPSSGDGPVLVAAVPDSSGGLGRPGGGERPAGDEAGGVIGSREAAEQVVLAQADHSAGQTLADGSDDFVGPRQPLALTDALVRRYEAVAEHYSGVTLAHASFFGPPDPAVLGRIIEPFDVRLGTGSDLARSDEFVGPEQPLGVVLVRAYKAAAATEEVVAARDDDDDFVGPRRPDPVRLASAEIVGPPRPSWLEARECGFVGPPHPDSVVVTARADEDDHWHDATSHEGHAGDAAAAADGDHLPHGLPFDPLAVGPFLEGPERVLTMRGNPFAKFLSSQNKPDTVADIHELKHRIRPGETISEVLGNLGMTQPEVDLWIRAADKAHNVDRVFAGQELALLVEMPQTELKRITLEIDPANVLIAERKADSVVARREAIQFDRSLRVAGAEIQHSLYMSAQHEGIPDKVISDVAEVLGWEINFGRELDAGAVFRVVYEELTRVDTSETIPGRVLAVELENRGKHMEGFYFTMPDGSHAGYYDRDGEGLGRAFMRYPVAYSRISSPFTTKRFHPVLKRNMPHYGVDFAAPTGTPVKAVADATVGRAGWYNGNGRFVKLRHDSVYESGYAHLSKIAPGIEPGAKVTKGQVIGYVGSTGRATGPHLHFAMYREGKYIDPLRASLPRTHSLGGNALAAFRMTVDMMDKVYAHATERDAEKIVTASAE